MICSRCSALFAVCASLFASAADRAAEVRVVGTDLLGVDFSRALYAFAGRTELRLALAFDGSRSGFDELKAGRADAALLVLAPGEEPAVVGYERWTLAYHRIVVLAPAGSPVEQLTLGQIEGIFGVGSPLNLSTWGELDLGGGWATASIVPHAPAVGTGIVAEWFRHTVLHDRAFKPMVVRDAHPAQLAAAFEGESRVLAIAAAPPPQKIAAKLVAVATRARTPAFLPTPENLHSGDYPLRLPLWIVFRREAVPTLRPLLRYLFGDEAVPILARAGLVPLPPAVRGQQLRMLESAPSAMEKEGAK